MDWNPPTTLEPLMTALNITAIVWTLLAIVLVPTQLKVAAPYGRHARTDWGPSMSNRLGWTIMELVSLVVFVGLFLSGPGEKTAPMWVFFALWTAHYVNRSLIFPWRTHTAGKTIPVAIVGSAIAFNLVNAGLNGFYFGWSGETYSTAWLSDPRFIIGLVIFLAGAAINIWSDNKLIGLRSGGTQGYSIPRGGLFNYVSCPNHMGEIIQWSGFALMCWNLPALSFAIWTAANLIPRTLAHHAWYRKTFPDYPQDRRAVIPALL
jgi:3-oxo-5-alpha-steroid 4-dehydrogenase 1